MEGLLQQMLAKSSDWRYNKANTLIPEVFP